MNHDPLESELEAIAPKPLSDDFMPHFQARLTTTRPAWRRPLIAGLAAAACVAIAAFALHDPAEPKPGFVTSQPAAPAPADPLPSVAQFEHAFQQSPQAVDALLQQRPVGPSQQQIVRTYDVTRVELN